MPESSDGAESGEASTAGLVLGFATLYIVWGSTYLAIRYAVETIPPFLMAGVRFTIAGILLMSWAALRGASFPSWKHWRIAVVTGALLLLCGNGGVVWAERVVPSGLTALLLTTTPFWFALLEWLRPGGKRPTLATWAGLVVGFAGAAVLALSGRQNDGQPIHWLGVAVLVGCSITWTVGSLIAKHAPKPASPIMGAGVQMLCGGAWLLLTSGVAGEWIGFQPSTVTTKSLLAVLYLLIFGSLLAMTVYNWLLHVTKPTLISTYIFVNPIIAVFLGWLLAGETLSSTTLAAGAVIVAAVAWLIWTQWRAANVPAPQTSPPATPERESADQEQRRSVLPPLPRLCGGDRELQ